MKKVEGSPRKVIKNQMPSLVSYINELWVYRDLLWTLAYRDLKIRYAQTSLGLLWGIFQPLATLFIFTLVFSVAIKVDTGKVPYPIFAFAGLYAWTYFSVVVMQGGGAVLEAQNLVTKIYFPRLILPLSKAIAATVDFAVNLLLMIGVMSWYKFLPGKNALYLPLWLIALVVTSLGVAIGLSALSIRFRDFQPIAKFGLQLGFYLTPIAYPSSLIPAKYLPFYYCNPMVGIVEGFRWMVTGGALSPFVFLSLAVACSILTVSWWYFRRIERIVADIV